MTLDRVVRLVLAGGVFVGWWVYAVWGVLQFQDLKHDQVKARQKSMGRLKWKVTNWIGGEDDKGAKARADTIRWIGFGVGVVLFLLTWRATYAITSALSVAVMVSGWKQKEPDVNEVQRLRPAVVSIIGNDAKGHPPKIQLTGEHSSGGPGKLTVDPPDGWEFWKKEQWNSLDRAVEFVFPGWENVRRSFDGIVWERPPELPRKVAYTEHLALPWNKIPVGPDGLTGIRCMNLLEYAHWGLFGDNGSGKTTELGICGTHSLYHRADLAGVVLFDIKAFGLKRFLDREGVIYQATDYEDIEAGFAWLRREYEDRKQLLARENKFKKPLIILWDEASETIAEARASGTKVRGVEHPQLVMDALSLGRLSRELKMHLIVADQRPDGTSMPTKLRAQLRGRVAFGQMDQKGAEMSVGVPDAPRVVNMRGGPGINVLKGRDWIGSTQGMWLANPHNEDLDKDDRNLALSLLPPFAAVRLSDRMRDSAADSAKYAPVDPMYKREPAVGTSSVASSAVLAGSVPSSADPKRLAKNERERTRMAKLREAMRRNPLHEAHGTEQGRRVCPCVWCKTLQRPNLVEVSP